MLLQLMLFCWAVLLFKEKTEDCSLHVLLLCNEVIGSVRVVGNGGETKIGSGNEALLGEYV